MSENKIEKEREVWNKQKTVGEKKFIVFRTVQFTAFMIILIIGLHVLTNYIFGVPSYDIVKVLLLSVLYIMILIFLGIKMSSSIWVKQTIKFDGIHGLVTELEDIELKNLILKGEKIMAAKRYRIVTGAKLREAIRYVDLISEYYTKKKD
ncbi:hypothetical protein [Clostridium sp. YIM B02506]|uniref:hypothetical protein n=1 Tax=Clostridium sp. YIM B02506 TaxID=2910680 RepID=UPI001EEDC7C7|nr:hypothetical protein [Clostridium sp. YIM B02506]